jgi:hypothetical protein
VKLDKIIAVARFNIDGDTAKNLDVIIHPDYRNKNLMRLMLLRGWRRFPYVKYLEYEREFKDKPVRKVEIMKILKLKEIN